MPEPRLGHDDAERQDRLIAEVLERAVAAGQESVRRGPDLLPVLREAGVVDAGGYGLTIIFAGVVAALRGAEAPQLDHHAPARVTHPQHESSTYRYCTNFAVTGEDLDASAWIARARGAGRLGARRRRPARRSRSTSTPTSRSARRRCSPAPARSRTSTSPTCTSRSRRARSGSPRRPPTLRRRSPSSRARAWRSCSPAWAPRRSTAARRSTRPRYELLAGIHARARPSRSSCCRTRRT